MPQPQARVMLPVAFQCYDTTTGAALDFFSGTVNISSVYRISNTSNELVVLGCNTLAYTTAGLVNRKWYTFFSGCLNYCFNNTIATDGACAGIGCCRTDIPPGLTDNSMTFYAATANAQSTGFLSHVGMQYSPCDYAFMVEKNTYDFRVSDLNMNGSSTTKPLVLDWAIRNTEVGNVSCAEVTNKPGYACLSKNSTCLNSPNGPGYFCNCTKGYWGNPYIIGGCQGKTNPSFQFVAPSINSADRHTVDPFRTITQISMNAIIRSSTLATVYAATAMVITIAHALLDNKAKMQSSMIALINSLLQQSLPSVHIHARFYISLFPQCYPSVLFTM
jgi:hypothetical protein